MISGASRIVRCSQTLLRRWHLHESLQSLPNFGELPQFFHGRFEAHRGSFDHSSARYVWIGPEAKTSHPSIEAALFEPTCSGLACGWPRMKPFRYVST